MRIDRMLANSGFGSRTMIKDMIHKGRVSVNGMICRDPGMHVKDSDSVAVDGAQTEGKRYLYYIFDKPDGVLTAMEDKRLPTVADYIPQELKGLKLSPVGRLDYHTTGLLLITNDGEMSHRLTSPKYAIPKTYLIEYEGKGQLGPAEAEELSKGLTLTDKEEETKLRPAILNNISENVCTITLTEGKTHEIRRIISHFGLQVKKLRRISLGPITLDDGKSGRLMELDKDQIAALRRATGLV